MQQTLPSTGWVLPSKLTILGVGGGERRADGQTAVYEVCVGWGSAPVLEGPQGETN